MNFDKYAQTGKAFVKKIATELGDEDNTAKASRILRATLHVLRDQSTPEESIQLINQLPMFIKAAYVDGWKPASQKGRVRHLDDFITLIQEKSNAAENNELTSKEGAFLAVQAVFRVIKEYASEGEMEDLKRTLPDELRVLLDDYPTTFRS